MRLRPIAVVISAAIALAPVLSGCSKSTPLYKQYEDAWPASQRANPTPGTLYLLSRGCQVTIRAIEVIDHPVTPVGNPVKSWQPVTTDTNSPTGTCHQAKPNETGIFYQPIHPMSNFLPESTNGPWVFSTLPVDQAVQQHVIPTPPFSTEEHPMGDPGYVYSLSSDCRTTLKATPVQHRPYYKHPETPDPKAQGMLELALTNGTYINGVCGSPEQRGLHMLAQTNPPSEPLLLGEWVYSTFPPDQALKLGLIPTAPQS